MKNTFIILLPVLILITSGCSGSRSTISASDPYEREEFHERFGNKKARIYTEYGQIINAENLILTKDSLYYDTRQSESSISIAEIERLERKGGVPGLTLLGVGTLAAGGVITAKNLNSESVNSVGQAFGGLILSGLGAIFFIISISSKGPIYYIRK